MINSGEENMRLIYLVYREENVMVYQSQVLEYLRAFKQKALFDSIELIVFRHEQNLMKRSEVEERIFRYIDKTKTFWSLPVINLVQLNINATRLKKYLKKTYVDDDSITVICRGDLAAYIGVRAFSSFSNSRILYDNRGLAYEESVMSHESNLIHKFNRNVKRKALDRTRLHCDMYNFVTNGMREYFLKQYGYNPKLPYTIIPTLYSAETGDDDEFAEVARRENYSSADYVISYVGSTAAWQSTKKLVSLIQLIGETYERVRFFVLSNGTIPEIESLSQNIRERVIVKSVPHKEIKYYLQMTNIGIVIRDNNIVNHVAAPTKIAEYLTSGVTLLYSGDIGVVADLKEVTDESQLICIDTDKEWLEKINPDVYQSKRINPVIVDYFDMNKRQFETYNMIKRAFTNEKVK